MTTLRPGTRRPYYELVGGPPLTETPGGGAVPDAVSGGTGLHVTFLAQATAVAVNGTPGTAVVLPSGAVGRLVVDASGAGTAALQEDGVGPVGPAISFDASGVQVGGATEISVSGLRKLRCTGSGNVTHLALILGGSPSTPTPVDPCGTLPDTGDTKGRKNTAMACADADADGNLLYNPTFCGTVGTILTAPTSTEVDVFETNPIGWVSMGWGGATITLHEIADAPAGAPAGAFRAVKLELTGSGFAKASLNSWQKVSGDAPGGTYTAGAWLYRESGSDVYLVGDSGSAAPSASGAWEFVSVSGPRSAFDDVYIEVVVDGSPGVVWVALPSITCGS